MNRRRFLAAGATAGAAALAGCRSLFQTRSARSPPLVDDRPTAVYYPTHIERMKMVGMGTAGDYRVALTYSFPHRFWNVTGSNRTKVEIKGEDSVHLMATVWDPDSGMVVPNVSVTPTITRDGETITAKPFWKMLSQNMSVHAGDNVALGGNGTYDIALEVGASQARATGAFAGKFERAETSFTFEYTSGKVEDITFERLTNDQGDRGAVEPMDMEMPVASTPAPEDLPGQLLGAPTSGDAVLATTALDTPPEGVDADGTYLAVSARTPYNGYPLPATGIEATHTRGGETLLDGETLQPTFDPNLGYHYGATTDGVESGDEVTLSVVTPTQLARHEGYETAFFEFEDATLTVE